MALCLCLSQVGVLSKWADGSSWFLACRLLSIRPILCFKEIQVFTELKYLQKSQNSGLRKFYFGISIAETCSRLSSRKADAQSVINWTVLGQLS